MDSLLILVHLRHRRSRRKTRQILQILCSPLPAPNDIPLVYAVAVRSAACRRSCGSRSCSWLARCRWLQQLLEGPGFYSETKPLISATCSFATRLPLIVRRESFWATLMKRRIFASCALFRGATISNRMDRDCKTSHKNTSWTFENASALLAEFQPLIDRVRQRRLKERRYHGKPARTAFVSPLKPQTE